MTVFRGFPKVLDLASCWATRADCSNQGATSTKFQRWLGFGVRAENRGASVVQTVTHHRATNGTSPCAAVLQLGRWL